LQPQLPIVALFDDEVRGFRGIPQAYAVTEHERIDAQRGLHGFRIEAVMGTPGIVATILPYVGHDAKEAMARYPFYAAALLLAPDDAVGRVTLKKDGRPQISYPHADEHKARLRDAIRVAARVYLAAGARRVEVPLARPVQIESERDLALVDDIALSPASAPLLSAHQQGGVRFSPDEARGAARPDGLVWGTNAVYVFDSSGFPSSSSSHTMTPIISVARYLTSQLLAT
jgi:choline dehydrogenase-like flavoprotein